MREVYIGVLLKSAKFVESSEGLLGIRALLGTILNQGLFSN